MEGWGGAGWDVIGRAYGFITCFYKWYLGHSESLCSRSLREGTENRMILVMNFAITRDDTIP